MDPQTIRIGELAQRTGLTVRALHHYDEVGLLKPSRRSPAGHRLYTHGDVARLLRIRALQQVGFSLEQVRGALDDDAFPIRVVIELRIARLREDLARTGRLCRRLEGLRERLRGDGDVPVGEFLEAIEEMTMFEKYYTPEQLEQLEKRRHELGEDTIRAVEAEWPKLIAAVREEMQNGTDPADPRVRALAARWRELVVMFTGGDPGITASLRALHAGEPQARARAGLDGDVMDYVGRALREAPGS